MNKAEENFRFKQTNEEILVFQKKLVPLIRKMNDDGEICFSSVLHDSPEGGYSWQPTEKIKGSFMDKIFGDRPNWAVATTKNIALDYQKVITQYFK